MKNKNNMEIKINSIILDVGGVLFLPKNDKKNIFYLLLEKLVYS